MRILVPLFLITVRKGGTGLKGLWPSNHTMLALGRVTFFLLNVAARIANGNSETWQNIVAPIAGAGL